MSRTLSVILLPLTLLFGATLASGAVGEPWLGDVLARGVFSPVNRKPLFRDELMDERDYYPDDYLAKLRDRRLAKLRKVVGKCGRYGIKVWLSAKIQTSNGHETADIPADPALFPAWLYVRQGEWSWPEDPMPKGRLLLRRLQGDRFGRLEVKGPHSCSPNGSLQQLDTGKEPAQELTEKELEGVSGGSAAAMSFGLFA